MHKFMFALQLTDGVGDPGAVVVEAGDALVGDAAVLRADRSAHDARTAELAEVQVGRLRQLDDRLETTSHSFETSNTDTRLQAASNVALTLTFCSRVERMIPASVRQTLMKLYMSMTLVMVNGSRMSNVCTYGQKYTNHVTYIQNLVAR